MTTETEAREALEAIKARYKTPGCCFILSKAQKGEYCECLLCLCDRVHDYITEREAKNAQNENSVH